MEAYIRSWIYWGTAETMCFDSQQEIGELLKKERAIQGIIAKFCGRPLGNKVEKKARSTGGKEYACNAGPRFHPWVGKIPWRREWQPTPVFLPGETHGQRNLAGCSPWGHKELDTTEWLTLSLSLYTSVCQSNSLHCVGQRQDRIVNTQILS